MRMQTLCKDPFPAVVFVGRCDAIDARRDGMRRMGHGMAWHGMGLFAVWLGRRTQQLRYYWTLSSLARRKQHETSSRTRQTLHVLHCSGHFVPVPPNPEGIAPKQSWVSLSWPTGR